MTIFHHKWLIRADKVLAIGWTHPPSITIFVHLCIKKCHSKRYHSDIKYTMTLNIIFSVAGLHRKGGLNCVLGARWLRASWVTSPGIGTFTLQTPLLTRNTYHRGPSAMAKSVLVLNSGSSSLKWVPNLRSRRHLTVSLSLSSFVRHISC
jgi:hypothetical protein